jgi:hypothetical protein
MEPKGTLKERWLASLEELRKTISQDILPSSELKPRLRSIMAYTAMVIAKKHRIEEIPYETRQVDDTASYLEREYPELFKDDSFIATLQKHLDHTNNSNAKLLDKRRQEDWASSWDHLKVFLYRTATTVMIAGVVLLAGYLAKQWEIPLPMLRGFTS